MCERFKIHRMFLFYINLFLKNLHLGNFILFSSVPAYPEIRLLLTLHKRLILIQIRNDVSPFDTNVFHSHELCYQVIRIDFIPYASLCVFHLQMFVNCGNYREYYDRMKCVTGPLPMQRQNHDSVMHSLGSLI